MMDRHSAEHSESRRKLTTDTSDRHGWGKAVMFGKRAVRPIAQDLGLSGLTVFGEGADRDTKILVGLLCQSGRPM